MWRSIGMAVLAIIGGTNAAAQAGSEHTVFGIQPILVNGSTNVQATSINNTATITGSSGGQAFILRKGVATFLPLITTGCQLPGCTPNATSIDAKGNVAGWYSNGDNTFTFLWSQGAYVQGYAVDAGVPVAGLAVLLNNRGELAFDYNGGTGGLTPFAGVPPAVFALPIGGAAPMLVSLNAHGLLAGTYIDPASMVPSVFLYDGKTVTSLLPSGAVMSGGGFINDLGQVAGHYVDSASGWHGFIYSQGTYAIFDPPANAIGFEVGAMNAKGRVAGSYTDIKTQDTRLFWYNGTSVASLGHFNGASAAQMTLNDEGVLVVSFSEGGGFVSYHVVCGGPGC